MKQILFALTLFCTTLFAESFLEQGNAFYGEELYDSAEASYLTAIENEGENSLLLYNLSNAVYRQHRLGEAILLLEKAQLLAPKDEDIAYNLAYLRAQTIDAIPEPTEGPVLQWLRALHRIIRLKTKLIILIVLSFVASLLLIGALFRNTRRTRTIYALLGTLCITAVIGLSAGIQIYTKETQSEGIVLVESVDAMNEPKGATHLFSVREGTKCHIVKGRDNWLFIKLSNGVAGWIPKESLGEI